MNKALGILVVTGAVLAAGCVQREMLITTRPPGAVVLVNGAERGTTPARLEFDFYGTHEIELRLSGYRTLVSVEKIEPPWYEVFPLDIVSELLLPVRIVDSHAFSYELSKYTGVEPDKLLTRAKDMSERLAEPDESEAAED